MSVTSVIDKTMNKVKENKRKVVFKNEGAFHLWKKVYSVYENAVFTVKPHGKAPYVFTTQMGTEEEPIALKIPNEMHLGAVEFSDTELNDTWEYLYGYLWNEDSAILFYGEKETAEKVGIRYTLGMDGDAFYIRMEALQVASLIDHKLLNEILKKEAADLKELEDNLSLGFD